MARTFLLILFAALTLTSCRENQKDEVRELDEREANTAKAIAADRRRDFENNVDEKLRSVKTRIDETRANYAASGSKINPVLLKEVNRQLDQLDSEVTSAREQFDQLKAANDEQFQARRMQVQRRAEEADRDWARFASTTRF